MKVRLLVADKSRQKVIDILSVNNITVDDTSSIVIIEDNYSDAQEYEYDVKIIFKEDKIAEFTYFIRQLSDTGIADMILGKRNDAYTPIKLSDVSYFNSINNDTYANLENGKSYFVKKKLYQIEEELYSIGFFRTNKSELVNMKKISRIIPMFKGKLIIKLAGHSTPFDISRGYTKAFKERLGF